MNISEFERTKPTQTMKALNLLIKDVEDILKINESPEVFWYDQQIVNIHEKLLDIKQKFKRGE